MQTQTESDGESAQEAALELGRELSDDGLLATRCFYVHEDEMDDEKVSLRIRMPQSSIHPQMLTALGERGFWLDYLGTDGYGRHEYVIQTNGDVHEGVY